MLTAFCILLALSFIVLGGAALAVAIRNVLFAWIALGVVIFAAKQTAEGVKFVAQKVRNRRVTHRAVPVSGHVPAAGTIYC